jgi:predicted acyltransferase
MQISHTVFAGLARHLGMFGEFLLTFGAFGVLWVGLYYMYRKQTFVRI